MNQKNLLGPIIFRFAFFAINLYFLMQINSIAGWNFVSFLLVFFATRDFVQGVRLAQVYYFIQKNNQNNDKNNK